MNEKYYVIKFGDMFLKRRGLDEYATQGDTVLVSLTHDLFQAERVEKMPLNKFEMYQSLGARIHEVSFYDLDKTYTFQRELEEKNNKEEDENEE